MPSLTKGADAIADKIKHHMQDHGWPQDRREKLWNAVSTGTKQVFATIPISLIRKTRNIRRGDSDLQVKELAESIKSDGLIQNPVVCLERSEQGGINFIMVAGHRRLQAFELLGLNDIDCAIRIFETEKDRLVSSFIENDVRKNMDSFDLAIAFKKMKDAGMSTKEISNKINRHVSVVNRFLKFNTWPDSLIEELRSFKEPLSSRDLFSLLSKSPDELALELKKISSAKNNKGKGSVEGNKCGSLTRMPAAEKRYNSVLEAVEKFNVDGGTKEIISQVLQEAKIIPRHL